MPVLWIRDNFGMDPDPHLWPMGPDPDSAIFILDLQDANKKLFFSLFPTF